MDTEESLLAEVEKAAATLEMWLARLRLQRLSNAADKPKESVYEKRGFQVFTDGSRD